MYVENILIFEYKIDIIENANKCLCCRATAGQGRTGADESLGFELYAKQGIELAEV